MSVGKKMVPHDSKSDLPLDTICVSHKKMFPFFFCCLLSVSVGGVVDMRHKQKLKISLARRGR